MSTAPYPWKRAGIGVGAPGYPARRAAEKATFASALPRLGPGGRAQAPRRSILGVCASGGRERSGHDAYATRRPTPRDIPGTGRWAVLKRTALEFKEDNLTDWAAALTYYAVLALFPALLALVALVGIFGQYPQTTNALIDVARQVSGGNSALTGLQNTINGVVQNKGGAGALLGLGLAGALWSASGYIGAFMRASNAIYEVDEGRPFWKLRPLQVVVTLVMVLLVALVLIALVVSGPLAKAAGLEARAGLGRGDRLPDRQVADHGRGRARAARAALLRGAERQAPAHPVAEPGRRRRRS